MPAMEQTRAKAYGGDTTDMPELLTVADLQRSLRVSRSTIYRLIREGALRPLYFDDRPRFLVADVRDFVESRRQSEHAVTAATNAV